jgi:uncharacterized protein YraI
MQNKPIAQPSRVFVLTLLALTLLAGCTSGQALVVEPSAVAATPSAIGTLTVSFDGISFRYDRSLAAHVGQEILPATARGGMFGTPSPAHTLFTFGGGPFPAPLYPEAPWQWHNSAEIFVYPSSGFASEDWTDVTANERLRALGQLLAQQPSGFGGEFPALPMQNAAQAIHAQIRYVDFENGRGVRFLTQYNQEARPINNQELVYVFQGLSDDGLHGVTAYFPVTHPSLPAGPQMSEADYQALAQNLDARMAEATRALNDQGADSFVPGLATLDDLVQSLHITPTETDFVVRETETMYVEARTDTPIYAGPGGTFPGIGTLAALDTVLVTGVSQEGDWLRVLCPDLSTGNCWVSAQADLNQHAFPEMEVNIPVTMTDVAQVQMLADSDIYNGPGLSYPVVGQLRRGETATVYNLNAEKTWWLIQCPGGIAQNCWIPADPAITQPSAFSVGDGWQGIEMSTATAIERALLEALTAQGVPTEKARIEVQKVADGYARVAVYYDVIERPDVWDLGFAYFENGAWTSWAFGSGIAQEHVEAAGIPRSVWPEGWLQPDAGS